MVDVGDLSALVTEWRGTIGEWSKIYTTKHWKRVKPQETFLNGKIKKVKDLKFVSTNISVSFLRSFSNFENGLWKETEILVETNFRSFTFFILPFKNVASGYTLCD